MNLSVILIAVAITAAIFLILIILLIRHYQVEEQSSYKARSSQGLGKGMIIGIAIGLIAGTSIGAAMNNIALGIALGAAFGSSIGVALGSAFTKGEKQSGSENPDTIKNQQNISTLLLKLGVLIVIICCLALGLFFFIKLK